MAGKRGLLAIAGFAAAALGAWSQSGFPPPAAAQAARAETRCARFPASNSTAYNRAAGRIDLLWRTDYPRSAPARPRFGDFEADWRAYLGAVLAEIRASGFRIEGNRVAAPADAQWWIAPWLDYGDFGREPLLGLTKERDPDAGDLSPRSTDDAQVWAIGFYDVRGASAFARVFENPCDPAIPQTGFQFPEGTVTFKFLFTTAAAPDLDYLDGAPTVRAQFRRNRPDPNVGATSLRLLQVDIAVRDSRASRTGWVFGTYVWRGPRRGDGLYDNLVPVGLMWGNDAGVRAEGFDQFATLAETRLNRDFDGILWQRAGGGWPARPWPGLQGRLNGPADNLRSSCLSCHATAQWPRSTLPMAARASLAQLATAATRDRIVARHMVDTRGGTLVIPAEGRPGPDRDAARPMDYSLQLQTSVERMCRACSEGRMSGATPALCRLRGPDEPVSGPVCPVSRQTFMLARPQRGELPPRQ